MGSGGLVIVDDSTSMPEFARFFMDFCVDESCGKCVPCRMGTRKGADLLSAASESKPLNRAVFDDLLETLELGSLCALGGGLPLPIRNIMEHFSVEVAGYFHRESAQ